MLEWLRMIFSGFLIADFITYYCWGPTIVRWLTLYGHNWTGHPFEKRMLCAFQYYCRSLRYLKNAPLFSSMTTIVPLETDSHKAFILNAFYSQHRKMDPHIVSIELSRKKVEQLGRNSPPLSTSKEEASFQFFSCAEKVKASKSYLIKGLKHLGQFYWKIAPKMEPYSIKESYSSS